MSETQIKHELTEQGVLVQVVEIVFAPHCLRVNHGQQSEEEDDEEGLEHFDWSSRSKLMFQVGIVPAFIHV
jgi:hypothetical protein